MPISLPLAIHFRRIVREDSARFAQLSLSIPWSGWQQIPSRNNSLVPFLSKGTRGSVQLWNIFVNIMTTLICGLIIRSQAKLIIHK